MSDLKKIEAPHTGSSDAKPEWLELVREYVGSLKFGTVQITVRDYRVVEVEKTEKLRFDTNKS